MKKLFFFYLALALNLSFFACKKESIQTNENPNAVSAVDRGTVVLPDGSHNALADALANHNTVILASGTHTEDNPVVVSGKKNIIGQKGAILVMGCGPNTDGSQPIEVGLHLKNASGSLVSGIKFQSSQSIGGTAMLLENSANATVKDCETNDFQYGILVEKSDNVTLRKNTLNMSTAWQLGEIGQVHGIVVVNGEGARVEDNEVTGAIFGIWPCDKNGRCNKNKTHGNLIGIILCKVPAGGIVLPDGTPTGAAYACQDWEVKLNNSYENFSVGYLVIDGANNNYLHNNDAANNGTYDIELTGDTYRFGFLTPFSFENTVKAKSGQTVKDCGVNNSVTGGILVDLNVDPCY
jgi:parallel beta-helix repeat protein